jgi:hypothetical protein
MDFGGRSTAPVRSCSGCSEPVRKNHFSLRCHACGTSVVGDLRLEAPAATHVLPFAVDRSGAQAALARWRSTRRFAPDAVRTALPTSDAEGVYLPFWSCGAVATADYEGRRGTHHWRTRSHWVSDGNGGQRLQSDRVRETDWTSVRGQVRRTFNGVVIPGLTLLDDDLPAWPLGAALVAYQETHLQEFRAAQFDRGPDDAWRKAQVLIEDQLAADCRADIGGDEQRVRSVQTYYDQVARELLLLPAWFVAYTFRGRTWSVLVNGSTGEVVGERPYSGVKISVLVGGLLVAMAVAVALVLVTR